MSSELIFSDVSIVEDRELYNDLYCYVVAAKFQKHPDDQFTEIRFNLSQQDKIYPGDYDQMTAIQKLILPVLRDANITETKSFIYTSKSMLADNIVIFRNDDH